MASGRNSLAGRICGMTFTDPLLPMPALVEQASADDCNFQKQLQFLYYPIQDLSVPNNAALHDLLGQLLQALLLLDDDDDDNNNVIYLHCWGGRGRAGLVGACLLSLLYPRMGCHDFSRGGPIRLCVPGWCRPNAKPRLVVVTANGATTTICNAICAGTATAGIIVVNRNGDKKYVCFVHLWNVRPLPILATRPNPFLEFFRMRFL